LVLKRIKKNVLVIILTLVLILITTTSGFFGECKVYAQSEINGCGYLTENANYALYLNEDDLSIVVEDKNTGAYMTSAPEYDDGKNNDTWLGAMHSAVVLTMINGNDDTQQADLVNDNVKKDIEYTENGFVANLYWSTYQLGLTLKVELIEDGISIMIPDDSISEDGKNYFIGTISVYPYLGSSYLDDKEGYMLVPDGNGALIYLNDKEGRFKSGFSGMIYGQDAGFEESNVQTLLKDKYNTIQDSEQVIAPIFGIAHTDDQIAFLGVVENGAARASIECIPNGASVDYNRAYAKFILRKTYTQPTSNNSTSGSLHVYENERSHSDLGVRYIFLGKDEADYSGMACAYRDYLIDNNDLNLDSDFYKTRIDFLGCERESWLLGTAAVVMTTVSDINEIYDELNSDGVHDIVSIYKGWQDGGLYDIPITKYKADSKIGGTEELTKLIQDSKEKGIDIYLYNEAKSINPDEKNATFNVVKQINKRRYEEKTYQDVYEKLLYLIPGRTDKLLNSFTNSYTKNNVNNLALAGITNTLFSYTYSGDTYTRFDTQTQYKETVAAISEKTNLVMEQPFAYLWGSTGAFLDMPLYTSNYVFLDEEVPFLSMVLKGTIPVYSEYVNFEANKREFFLKLVETGTYPSFYITREDSSELLYTNSSDIYSSKYDSYHDTIVSYTNELKELNEELSGATIIDHQIESNGLRIVTYSNGKKVYVNYGSEAVSADQVNIAAMSYEVR